MAKLYLIRRNLEAFSGPMTIVELKDAYKRMAFGLQDEVSGHCGPWVTFEDLSNVRKHYPEIAKVVHEDLVSGWGVSGHDGKLVKEDSQVETSPNGRGIQLALLFLALALCAFLAALYFATGARFAGRTKDGVDPGIEDAQDFINRSDLSGFDSYMHDSLEVVVEKMKTSKKIETQWLPYIRLYALRGEGSIPGISAKVLRGEVPGAFPDCSLNDWRQRWRDSIRNWGDLLVKHKLLRSHWSRLLAWDPHWIARRQAKGWFPGTSYYLLCATMADNALNELVSNPGDVASFSEAERIAIKQIKQRIEWIIEVSHKGQPSVANQQIALQGLSGIGLWTCFEAARDVRELNRCRVEIPPNVSPDDKWYSYTEDRYGWNILRLAMAQKGPLTVELNQALSKYVGRSSKGDFNTSFDYRYEYKLWRALLKNTGSVEKVLEKYQSELGI